MAAGHILIPIHDFNSGGTEAIAFRLADEWVKRGWRVTVLAGANDGPMRDRVPDAVAIESLDPAIPRNTLSRLGLGAAMAPRAKAIAPDLIFIIGNFHFILAHALKRALPDTPIVAKISNPLLPDGPLGRLAKWFGAPLLRRFLAPVDHATTMSAGLAHEVTRMVPHLPVEMIRDPNVPDTANLAAMADRRQAAAPLDLLLVGRFEPQKNIPLALRTLAILRQRRDARLTILGEGGQRTELEGLVQSLGLDDAVAMPGFSNDVGGAFARSDLLLISSRFEGVPGVAAEALAASLPVVSTDCSHFLRETITDPRLGRLVPGRSPQALADAIEAQMNEAPAPPEILARAVEPSRYGASATAYLTLFEELIANKSP
ncbi:MAG: glycosyltransferase [Proteobacteria bacterium]|nr:glycosyltransferase [Pseudomonadota bacterium]